MPSSEKSTEECSESDLRTEKDGEAEGFEVSIGSTQVEELPDDFREDDLCRKNMTTAIKKTVVSSAETVSSKTTAEAKLDPPPLCSSPDLVKSDKTNPGISRGGWMEDIIKKKGAKNQTSPFDSSEVKDNQGETKRQKCSEFLKTKVGIERAKDKDEARKEVATEAQGQNGPSVSGTPSSLSYKEGEEWIGMGEGQTYVVKGIFAFIRSMFGTLLLSFAFEGVKFERQSNCIYFIAKGRKSTPTGYEIVDRSYKLEFLDSNAASEIMGKVSGGDK